MITILRCFFSFKTVVTSRNILVFKIFFPCRKLAFRVRAAGMGLVSFTELSQWKKGRNLLCNVAKCWCHHDVWYCCLFLKYTYWLQPCVFVFEAVEEDPLKQALHQAGNITRFFSAKRQIFSWIQTRFFGALQSSTIQAWLRVTEAGTSLRTCSLEQHTFRSHPPGRPASFTGPAEDCIH